MILCEDERLECGRSSPLEGIGKSLLRSRVTTINLLWWRKLRRRRRRRRRKLSPRQSKEYGRCSTCSWIPASPLLVKYFVIYKFISFQNMECKSKYRSHQVVDDPFYSTKVSRSYRPKRRWLEEFWNSCTIASRGPKFEQRCKKCTASHFLFCACISGVPQFE